MDLAEQVATQEEKIDIFQLEHKEIIAKYGDIPPPEKNLRVSIIVPSLAELHNGNFWRFMRSLCAQRGVATDEYEALVIINNSEAAVVKDESESSEGPLLRGSLQSKFEGSNATLLKERYRENQKHLLVLKHLMEAQRAVHERHQSLEEVVADIMQAIEKDICLTPHQKNLFKQAVKKNIRIHAVDCSSKDKAFPYSDRVNPIGNALNIGGHLAYERLVRTDHATSGLIDFLNADCFISSLYIAQLKKVSHRGVVIKPMKLVVTEIPKSIETDQRDPQFRLASLLNYLKTALIENRMCYVSQAFPSSNSGRSLSGPQLAVNPILFESVHGYVKAGRDEDFAFGRNVLKKTALSEQGYMSDAWVYVSDRERIGSTDGAQRALLPFYNEQTPFESILSDIVSLKAQAVHVLLSLNRELETSPLAENYKAFRKNLYRLELIQRNYFRQSAVQAIGLIAVAYRQNGNVSLNPREVLENLMPTISTQLYDFLNTNLYLIEAIGQIIKNGKTRQQDIVAFFDRYLAEYFEVANREEPNYQQDFEALSERVALQNLNVRNYVHIVDAAYQALVDSANQQMPYTVKTFMSTIQTAVTYYKLGV